MTNIVEAGVDYFRLHTAMWSEQRDKTPTEVQSMYLEWLEVPHLLSFKRMQGYDGIGDEYFFIGQREDGWLRSFAGGCADVLFDATYMQGDNPARIDLQVTVKCNISPLEVIQTHKSEANTANHLLPSTRQRSLSEHSDNKGGMTFYIGSRYSEAFGRIYHKYAKSKEERYKECVRYEIQLSGRYAAAYAEIVSNAVLSRQANIVRLVREWFQSRGILPLIPLIRDNWVSPVIPRPKTSEDTTMIWLKQQVRPAIARLLQTVPKHHILDAVGLAEPDTSIEPQDVVKEVF